LYLAVYVSTKKSAGIVGCSYLLSPILVLTPNRNFWVVPLFSERNNVTLRRVGVTIVAVEKSISATYPYCVFVASGIHNAMGMRHNIICGLSGFTIFLYSISYTA